MKIRRYVLLLVLTALVVSACAVRTDDTGTAARPTPQSLLAFTATTVDGKQFDGTSLSGKPAVLWFWAPWCVTCLQQAPAVVSAGQRYAGTVNLIGVAGQDKTEAMPDFVQLAKLSSMTNISDADGALWKRFGAVDAGAFVFLDATGAVLGRGVLSGDELSDKIGALLVPSVSPSS